MSVPTTLQSRLVPFAISQDDITYKNVVCKKAWNLNLDIAVTQEESDCSVHTAVATPKWSFDFEIVLNLTPNGATEVSANEVIALANAQTRFYVKVAYASSYYRQGAGYISNWRESAPQGGFITATGTFTGDGTLDTSA